MLNNCLEWYKWVSTLIPRSRLVVIDLSVTVVQLVMHDCTHRVSDPLYHSRQYSRHRQYEYDCGILVVSSSNSKIPWMPLKGKWHYLTTQESAVLVYRRCTHIFWQFLLRQWKQSERSLPLEFFATDLRSRLSDHSIDALCFLRAFYGRNRAK